MNCLAFHIHSGVLKTQLSRLKTHKFIKNKNQLDTVASITLIGVIEK